MASWPHSASWEDCYGLASMKSGPHAGVLRLECWALPSAFVWLSILFSHSVSPPPHPPPPHHVPAGGQKVEISWFGLLTLKT